MEAMRDLTALGIKLSSLSSIYSIWYFNRYLRVTYVAPNWLVVWDHRYSPPQRYDIKEIGNHEAVCRLAAEQLNTLAAEYQA